MPVPFSSLRNKSGARVFGAAVVAALFVAGACNGDRSPAGPPDAAATVVASTVPLVVTVVTPDGKTPVAQATVRAYGFDGAGMLGPVATAVTDAAGVATLNVVSGNYCLSARTAPLAWLGLDLITPPTQLGAYPSVPAAWGPVVTGRRSYVPFNQANFDYCYTELPVRVGNNGGKETVAMVAPFLVLPEVLDLEGDPLTGVDVYAVIPVNAPWADAPPGVKTAFLSAFDRTASPANVVVSQGAQYALEFQQSLGPFNITGSFKGTGGAGGGSTAFTLEASPLMCKQTLRLFPTGQTGIDFTKVNFGYHATLGLAPDLSMVAVELLHTGSGPVTVTFRTDLPMGRLTTTVDYACANGNCGGAVVRTSGGNPQAVHVFHMAKGNGLTKTTMVLADIPANHTQVLFAAKSPGDAIPLSARDDATNAFFQVERPPVCVIEQSNDDKWVVGDL